MLTRRPSLSDVAAEVANALSAAATEVVLRAGV